MGIIWTMLVARVFVVSIKNDIQIAVLVHVYRLHSVYRTNLTFKWERRYRENAAVINEQEMCKLISKHLIIIQLFTKNIFHRLSHK